MKLRLESNTIRLRLSQPEVESLSEKGILVNSIYFPGDSVLIFEICIDSNINSVSAGFINNMIVFRIPPDVFEQFTTTELVGFEKVVELENGQNLSILVEKDFKKLTRKGKDNQAELYPNPKERN